ncbi:DNA repair exonuclease SbcCD nuclease subunit [Nonomuraea polychroma]|uniref:DNA repair exonuclease SbcCD nuclease subunit n=1 Tax=Nonomuraea polychroma TaxID=46176 RepID=A0A438MDZ4_9ACTN|nr:metallophosphoesterase [Nonomuraea polychroma]RVX43751.1 DNA repair exonuclease SbcCD nuclease subunit [Nonomuraea polychroma]
MHRELLGALWRRGRLGTAAVVAALLASGPVTAAYADPGDQDRGRPTPTPTASQSPPTLTPAGGSYLEGTVKVAAVPTAAGDSVAKLDIDGTALNATRTVGVSKLRFDVGSNSTEAQYRSYVLVNGAYRSDIGNHVNERATIEIPNEHLVKGENTVEIVVGAIQSSCGLNHDDFVLSDVGLELLGEVADGEDNPYTLSFGDGSCGTNTSLLKRATLTFFTQGDPQGTTGLAADVDTTTLANGEHAITATTAAGVTVKNTVTVNNAPAGAPRLQPTDGTLVAGTKPVFATVPAAGAGGVKSLTVDGKEPVTKATLGNGAAMFSFDVGADSIDDRFDNFLLVNGKRIDLGGSWASRRVTVAVPARFLAPGDNTIKVVTGDYRESCGNNRDDFTLSNLALALDGATVTGQDIKPSYEMGDGACGSSQTALREVELRYTIDAPAVHLVETLGSGNATLSFNVGSNSIEARYQNFVLVNGQKVVLDGDFVSRRVDLPIPNEYLVPGWNTIDFVAGTYPTSCGNNRDDFAISNIVLTPVQGTAAGQMLKASYGMGDGNCGDNVNPLTEIDLEFLVTAPARGLRADLDTTKLEDGKHTIAAASTTGETATRLLITDNTAPKVAQSVPAADEKITAAVVLDVKLEDANGVVSGPDVKLDGQPIVLGAKVGPGLRAGKHTLAVTGADGLGNTATREIVFESAGIPDVPAELSPALGAVDVSDPVTLSAKVAEPDGGQVTATFSEANILTPNQVFQGTAQSVPTTLRVPGEKQVKGDALEPADGRTLDAPAGQDLTYQRYDIQVKGHVDSPVLRWEGAIDPERLASLRVWNTKTKAWDLLTSARGAAEGKTVLTAVVDADYIDRQQVHVMVTGEDPFADDIEPGDPNGFADPATYDFSIAHFTDTQYLSEGAVEQESAEERAVWESAYAGIVNWIKDNKDQRKISYVAHTGDIIENNIRKPADEAMQRQVVGEFEVSSKQHRVLDDADIPNGVIAGNHDNQAGTETGPEALYNKYYGPSRYQEAAQGWQHAEYGGPWKEGDNQNHYDLFSAGGLDFVVVGLSYGVTREEAEWADSVFKKFAGRNGILLSHDYIVPSTSPDGRGAGFAAPDGSMLYKTVVEKNPNVFLILAGHEHGVGTNVKPKVGQVGNGVVELLADYQFYTVSADRLGLTEIGGYKPDDQLQFGASFLRLLQFNVKRAELSVDTYSPLLNDFGAGEFDPLRRYNGLEDNMVLPVDLTSRTTTFQTDSLALYEPIRTIGKSTAASGQVASVTWDRLKDNTAYAWFVTARSAGGGVTASEPSVFVTKDEHGRPGTWGPDSPMYRWFER